MKSEIERLLMAEVKRAGGNKGKAAATVKKVDQKFDQLQRKAEADAKNLRLQAETAHFKDLLNKIRVMPSIDVSLASVFPPKEGDTTPPIKDDGYMAIIGILPEHAVWGGDPNSFWHKVGGNNNVGTWRNGGSIRVVHHISIFGYRNQGIGSEKYIDWMLDTAQKYIPSIWATVRVFDNNGKTKYTDLDELKADIAHVLSKIYKLPNPVAAVRGKE